MVTCISCRNEQDRQKPIEKLGQYLFFDSHLSLNNTKSCASCHDPKFAFTDGYRRSVSPFGENLKHNAPSLLNTQSYAYYDWNNPGATDYITQMQRPLYGKHPVELGLDKHWESFNQYITSSSRYTQLIKKAFNNKTFTKKKLEEAIASYLKTLKSDQSAFDLYARGQSSALSNSAKRGMLLFTSEKLKCVRCHMPPDFTIVTNSQSLEEAYVNIGLYNIEGKSHYPEADRGLMEYSKKSEDDGKFRVPSLRNCAVTAPYMHDGSVTSLSEVIDIYAHGGRGNEKDLVYGNGPANRLKHQFITGFTISETEKKDLINFLKALTDTTYMKKKRFQNPFMN